MTGHRQDKRTSYKREFGTIDYVHEYDLDIENRDIFLFGREDHVTATDADAEGGVEFMMANRFIRNLRILQAYSDDSILIHMKTCGGYWEEGMAIYSAIKACPNYVSILNYTWARSMSSLILQAADYRAMMPDSVFMYHDGTFNFTGTIKQFHTEHAQVERSTGRMMDIYLDRAEDAPAWEGRTRSQIKKIMRNRMDRKEEVYLTPEETVEHGFADTVFGADGTYDWTKLRG